MVKPTDTRQQRIARTWSGTVPLHHADGFYLHLLSTGVAEAQSQEGYLGGTITNAEADCNATFTLTTFWRDLDAMLVFASSDEAILYPGDEKFDLEPDLKTTIAELAHHAWLAEK